MNADKRRSLFVALGATASASLGVLFWYLALLRTRRDLRMMGHDYLLGNSWGTPPYISYALFLIAFILFALFLVRLLRRSSPARG
jgi:hypothetical protein